MFSYPEFQFLEYKVDSIRLNTTSAYDHFPEVKCQTKVIGECMQAHHANLNLPSFTRWMAIELGKDVVMFLKKSSPNSGI